MTTTAPVSDTARDADGDFDGFYRAHFGDTVAMVYTFTANLPEAQDIAQEAINSPNALIKVATAYLLRQRTEEVPGVSPNHVAVVAALRKLPTSQREAIVLHYTAASRHRPSPKWSSGPRRPSGCAPPPWPPCSCCS